jgi:hypothetical protein
MVKHGATKKKQSSHEIRKQFEPSAEPIIKILSWSSFPVIELSELMENSSVMAEGLNAKNGSSSMKKRNNNSPKIGDFFVNHYFSI